MGISMQLYAVSSEQLARFQTDPDATEAFMSDRYLTDVEGESAWLDKSLMGILEALGVLTGEAAGPATWLAGKDGLSAGGQLVPFVDVGSVAEIADYLDGITDAEFVDRVASNEIDNEVDYLAPYFAAMRGFYRAAADRGAAVIMSPPG